MRHNPATCLEAKPWTGLPLTYTGANGEIRFPHIFFIKKRHFTGIILIYIFLHFIANLHINA